MHLPPPSGTNRIVIDRFSPLYRDHMANGIGPIAPLEGYRALYPPWIDTTELANHITADYSTELLDDADLV